ncbi:helix-turn-helix domain-containing protein [Domibacillus sp. PGB-M46]|uniref:helix-turn-helix domain-containing protein n=1 Tax=Domibacillus sp. PGB-M46 TaxID=2910255 RepID=UPI001F5A37CD|nr:helix-turn-helix domain-containing protein [Domibacillus sp. PGB-M46]MCI2255803.1 helix-turn-helix domain-containing protein [Domibacillus sp. PGB-M46]
MMLNYRFEIFPNEEQKSTLHSWVNLYHQQYNSALLDKQRAYQKNKKNLTKSDLSVLLTRSKKHHPYLKKVPSQPLQETQHDKLKGRSPCSLMVILFFYEHIGYILMLNTLV